MGDTDVVGAGGRCADGRAVTPAEVELDESMPQKICMHKHLMQLQLMRLHLSACAAKMRS